jgi:putative pre-16S rRNA nuclease
MREPPVTPADRSRHAAAPPRVVVGFDFGAKRIGAAVGDTLTGTARPLATLQRAGNRHFEAIEALLARYAPQQIVVGLPYNMDGTETSLTPGARAFARELEQRYGRPVALVDERLSSREAEAALRAARRSGLRRRRVTHADVDREAARVIVERWLSAVASDDRAVPPGAL